MNRVVRRFLLWVMVLAMPVQGMAASLMLFCGPSHERMMQGRVVDHHPAPPQHAQAHAHAKAQAQAHPQAQALPGPELAQPSGEPGRPPLHERGCDGATGDDGPLVVDAAEFSCSACAACCSMLAIPARFTLPARSEPAQRVPLATAVAPSSPLPDGLDRPPRATFA